MISTSTRTGGCACGAVRYELRPARLDIADCHCRLCQRSVGAAYVTWATAPVEALRLVSGEPTWWASSDRAERGHCAICGTSLFFRARGGGAWIDITVASFDDPAELHPTHAIWAASRQPWTPLDPALPAHQDAGPDWTPQPPAPPSDPAGLSWREGPEVDVLQLAALFAAVGFGRSRDPGYLRAMLLGSRWIVSAWRGSELVGFARAVSDGVSNAYVSTVAVRPDHQRQGIGRELMRRLLADRDSVRFVLHTSEAGERLYRGFGFAERPGMLVRPRREQR